MNLKSTFISITLLLILSINAHAVSVSQRTIKQVDVVDVNGEPNVLVKLEGGVPSTSCTDQTAFVRPLNDHIGKFHMSTALTALAIKKKVDVIGTNTCGAFNVEIMKNIKLYD